MASGHRSANSVLIRSVRSVKSVVSVYMRTLRKHRISRLEEFSDAVFGFALTLLVITSAVPRSYDELIALVRGIPAFACCFALLVWVWYEHDSFFERYPLDDAMTVVLNSALLFFVLLYVYSLKFMFDAFMFQVFGLQGLDPVKGMSLTELARASTLYGLGFCVLMLLFTALYLHAHRRRAELELTPDAAFEARAIAGHHALSAIVGVVVAAFAWFGPLRLVFIAPMGFALMGPGHWWFGRMVERRRQALAAAGNLSRVT